MQDIMKFLFKEILNFTQIFIENNKIELFYY